MDILLAKNKSLAYRCPAHRNVSTHGIIKCHHLTAAATDLGWAVAWNEATTSVDKSRSEYKARLTGNQTPTPNSTNQPINDYSRSVSMRSKLDWIHAFEVNLSTAQRTLATSKDVSPTSPPKEGPLRLQLLSPQVLPTILSNPAPLHPTVLASETILTYPSKDPSIPLPVTSHPSILKKKWAYHAPKNKPMDLPLHSIANIPLPPPTAQQESFLHNNDMCWEVYDNSTPTIPTHKDITVVDSGSKHTICCHSIDLTLFDKDETPYVKLADDTNRLPIRGY